MHIPSKCLPTNRDYHQNRSDASSGLAGSQVKWEIELFRASWVADYPDPENYLLPINRIIFHPMAQTIRTLTAMLLTKDTKRLLRS